MLPSLRSPFVVSGLLSLIVALPAFAGYNEYFDGDVTDKQVKETLAKNHTLRSVKFFKTPMVTDASLEALAGHNDLELVTLVAAPNIAGTGLKALHKIAALKKLELEVCKLSDEGLKCFAILKVQSANFTESTVSDRGAWYISCAPSVEYLNLSDTQVTDTGVGYLMRLPNLKYLYLRNDDVSDASLGALLKLKNLETLDVRNTKITAQGLQKLKSLPHLKKLYTNENPL